MRSVWTGLPSEVREAVTALTGEVRALEPAPAGNHAHLAGTLHTASGRIFVKGSRKDAPDNDGAEVRTLRHETNINPHVQPYAPRLFWTVEEAGWLLAPVLDDVSPMAGDALLHADLNAANLLVTSSGRAFVVDWAFTSRGAAWVEVGLLIPWLIKAGHNPAETAGWIAQFPSWADADPAALDRFAWAFAETWRRRSAADPSTPWKAELATLAQLWADYRHN